MKPTIALSQLLTFGHPEFSLVIILLITVDMARGVGFEPTALSNMGLAIPRPTRLGDPRSHIETRFSLLLIIVSK